MGNNAEKQQMPGMQPVTGTGIVLAGRVHAARLRD
jgi:hypothetical protein